MNRCLVVAAPNVLIMCLACALPVHGQAITPEEIIAHVSATRAEIRDIEVSYKFFAVDAPETAIQRESGVVAIHGNCFAVDFSYSDVNGRAAHQFASFDGENGWGYHAPAKTAYTVSTGGFQKITDKSPVDASGRSYFGFAGWYPAALGRGESAVSSRDLVAWLVGEHIRVRNEIEVVDGHECYVVDAIHPLSGQPHESIWIDPERGYLPVIQRYFTTFPDGSREPLAELRILDAVQVTESAWLPIAAESIGFPNSLGNETSAGHSFLMAVQVDLSGQMLLRVNQGIPEERFDCSGRVPAGVPVINLDTNDIWIAGIADFNGMADTAIASLPAAETTISFAESPSTAMTSVWRNPFWLGAMGAATLASIAMFMIRRFR